MDLIQQLFTNYNAMIKSNPFLAGMLSLYGLGIATFVLWRVPKRIFFFLRNQMTTRLVIDNTQDGMSDELFRNTMDWYSDSKWSHFSRVIRIYSGWQVRRGGKWTDAFNIGIDGSPQFLMWEGRPCMMRRNTISQGATQSNKIIYEVVLTRLGRDRDSLMRLFDAVKPHVREDELYNYHFTKGDWHRGGKLHERDLATVVTTRGVKESIMARIDWFLANEVWYKARGIPYKLCIMLEGPPGNGKSSLVRALACHYERDVFNISLPSMTDDWLRDAFGKSSEQGILVLEDFNIQALQARNRGLSVAPTKARTVAGKRAAPGTDLVVIVDDESPALEPEQNKLPDFLTLHGFLNVFDGLDSVYGKIIFLTTNVKQELDAAVIRKGRVDHTFHIGQLTDIEVREYINRAFPGHAISDELTFNHISGADLQDLYLNNPDDFDDFVTSIPFTLTAQVNQTDVQDHAVRSEAVAG